MSENNTTVAAASEEKICPTVHKQVLAQKDELALKVVAYEKEISDLKKLVDSYRDAEKATVLASIKDCVDTEAYKDKDLETLKVIANAVLEAKKKLAEAPVEFSGADTTATVRASAEDTELIKAGYTAAEIAEYKALIPELKKYGLVN